MLHPPGSTRKHACMCREQAAQVMMSMCVPEIKFVQPRRDVNVPTTLPCDDSPNSLPDPHQPRLNGIPCRTVSAMQLTATTSHHIAKPHRHIAMRAAAMTSTRPVFVSPAETHTHTGRGTGTGQWLLATGCWKAACLTHLHLPGV